MHRDRLFFSWVVILLTVVAVGCGAAPAEDVTSQEVLLQVEFSQAADWPESVDVSAGTAVQLTDSGYELSSETADYVWAFGPASFGDVVLETTVTQLSAERNNAYGLACRAGSNSQNGYYFLISGDGFISIRRFERSLSSPIVDWMPHAAVRQGERSNLLRVICAGEYLALYVNGQLAAEGRDGRFAEGRVGFAASGSEAGPVQVNFDALTVRAAQISQR